MLFYKGPKWKYCKPSEIYPPYYFWLFIYVIVESPCHLIFFWHYLQDKPAWKKNKKVKGVISKPFFNFYQVFLKKEIPRNTKNFPSYDRIKVDVLVFYIGMYCKVHIFWEGQNFAKSPLCFWLALHRTKVRRRFCKILWPSQNIWTLNEVSKLVHVQFKN